MSKSARMNMARTPSGLRPDIQAMRALAALMVVVFHLWPTTFTGGYIGVDVFFVISGFLITSHILREIEAEGTLRLARFWSRRARRLLPAAMLVLVSTAVAIWFFVPEAHYRDFFKGIAASALYVENWSLARDSVDYLAAEAAASPTQHYWTLSVEEQFYIFWPLLVVLALALAAMTRQRPRLVVAWVLGLATIASFACGVWFTAAQPQQAFFVTPTRAWEFGAGAMLAFASGWLAQRLRSNIAVAIGWCAMAAIVAAGFFFDGDTQMPGLAALIPVGASLAVIGAGLNGTATGLSVNSVLNVRPVQFLGDISYAIYLWHWPLIILIPYARGQENGWLMSWTILAATIIVAAASTKLIEDPIRFSRAGWLSRPRPVIVTAVGTAVLVAAGAGAVIVDQNRQAQRDEQIVANFLKDPPECAGAASVDAAAPCENSDLERILVPSPETADDDRPGVEVKGCASRKAGEPIESCRGGNWQDDSIPKVMILGDSHARMMSTAFVTLAAQNKLAWEGYFQSGCLWTTQEPWNTKYVDECNSFKERLPSVLESKVTDYDMVVITGRASKLPGSDDEIVAGLRQAWSFFIEAGVPVVVLSDAPEIGEDVIDCVSRVPREDVSDCAKEAPDVLRTPDPFLLAAEGQESVTGIDLHPLYCQAGMCPVVTGGVLMYADENHLSATYVTTMAPIIERELRSSGLLS